MASFCGRRPRVVEAGPDLPGEKKGPADADGADRPAYRHRKESLASSVLGHRPLAETMGPDAVDDAPDRPGVNAVACEDAAGQRRPGPAVADPAVRLVLLPAPISWRTAASRRTSRSAPSFRPIRRQSWRTRSVWSQSWLPRAPRKKARASRRIAGKSGAEILPRSRRLRAAPALFRGA